MANTDEILGMIDEVFEQDQDIINDLEETNEIDQPADDDSIPDADEDTGGSGDATPESVQKGDTVEPDAEDIIDENETQDLTEYDVAVEESEPTPIIENQSNLPTIGNVQQGDRVMIALINGQPTVIGTVGSGDRQQEEINVISADVAVLGTVVAGKADITDLQATNATVQNLQTTKADVTELNAATASITALQTSKADVTELNAAKGRITTLEGDYANLNTVVAGKVDTNTLTANYITSSQIASSYASIDAANVNSATLRNAWVDKVMVQSGLLAHQGTVYTLDAIQLNADRITAGTIDVQRLIVTVDNHKYLVQFDAQGTPSYQKLDGDVIQDLTITADKIVAGAVTAQKITTSNIVGTGGWINLRNGTFNYNNATSGQGISWDGTNLSINANSINIGTTNVMTSINEVKDTVDNISVGGRNLALLTSEQRSSREDDKQYITSFVISDYGKSLMKDTDTYFTVSFDYKINGDYSSASDNSRIYAMIKGTGIVGGGSYNALFVKNAPAEGHYTATAKLSSAQVSSTSWLVRTRWNGIVNGCTYTVKNLKFEIGNIETSWTPAPQDIENTVSTVENTATTAKNEVDAVQTLIRQYSSGVLVCKTNNTVGALVNADGSFDITNVTWSGGTPTAGTSLATFGTTARIGTTTGNNVLIDSSTIDIKNGSTTLASFGSSGIQIGTVGASNTYAVMDSDSFDLKYGSNSDEFVHFGYGEGNAQVGTAYAPYFTLGGRASGYQVGNYSFAEGGNSVASGYASHAEAGGNAAGNYSHAEGGTYASGFHAHSEGLFTKATNDSAHAQGESTEANGKDSHAEGYSCYANGNYSHAQNQATKASGIAQTAIGKYNVEDSTDTYAFIIGNGANGSNRSNALTVDWNGHIVSADGFNSAMPPFKWKSASYTASNLASGYTDVTTNVLFPNLTGYARTIMVVGTNSAYTGATGAYIDSDNKVHIRCRNFNTASSSPTISFILIYLNNSYTWT